MDKETIVAQLKKIAPNAHEITLSALADLFIKDPNAVKELAKLNMKLGRKGKTPQVPIGPSIYEGIQIVNFD